MKQNVVSKTFAILRAFTDKQYEWGVNELSRHLEMPVSTVHRLLSLLKEEKVLEYSEKTAKYRIGPDFIRMASIISSQIDVKKYARSFLVELSRNLKHSVYFALYFPQERKLSFVESIKSLHALQFVLEIGTLEPIHVASSGKSILAYLSEDEIHAVLAENVESELEREKIQEELKKIKAQGFAITANERKKGAQSISAPVFDASGVVIGSIICVMPVSDYEHEKESYYVSCIKKAADDLSYSLGYKNA
ncbi:IclR family transcriptional regulator [Bacillus sp. B15-48]|uniref:IclR family transcriptional regulator n=1 Tax=Bacillus sp. B15-48 TaxID=1548601 RepID=UPI00193F5A5A|nr:IclR family transcriptional regulator [Bacillus sp. B15-48]MBM4763218.1 helix-turn-helix domain-containing protein [Bacillus sp. B15-48]